MGKPGHRRRTKTKPYVIYSYALVPNNETLIIDKGARVYFHANSGLIIPRTGTIKVNGDNPPSTNLLSLENEVTFEGDRLEPAFENTPGLISDKLKFVLELVWKHIKTNGLAKGIVLK